MISLPSRIIFFTVAAIFIFTGCADKRMYSLNLLPAPEIYADGLVNPFTDMNPVEILPYRGILYATDRAPVEEGDKKNRFYSDLPGACLRLGIGHVEISGDPMTREETQSVSIRRKRKRDYPLMVSSIKEYGILDRTTSIFMDPALKSKTPEKPGHIYAAMINKKLAISKNKTIYIYIPGYKVNFENPLLITGELWHYLGYDGVFIAYSWPATVKGSAYFGDTDKAKWASRNFRIFLRFLSEETDVENIQIVAYSMGTRVAALALEDLALIYQGRPKDVIRKELRIGNVLLISSDMSTYAIESALNDGLLNVPRTLTIYTSESDNALGTSSWLYGKKRLGQITPNQIRSKSGIFSDFLRDNREFMIADASHAIGSDEGNGHHYFRKSPWVSSDILTFLAYNLLPENRGLIQNDTYVWEFPDDYPARLRQAIEKINTKQ